MTESHAHRARLGALTVGALGVVFGDIGTSPLYTLKECLHATGGHRPPEADLYGVLSLIFWALMMVVTVKYLTFIMRADNKGEGGILALLALVPEELRKVRPGRIAAVALFAVMGAALLYGDGVITPAISVLSAVEGLAVANEAWAGGSYTVELRDSFRAVRPAESWHRDSGPPFRSNHDDVVHNARRVGACTTSASIPKFCLRSRRITHGATLHVTVGRACTSWLPWCWL